MAARELFSILIELFETNPQSILENGNFEVVKLLLECGADVNQCRTSDNSSPLFIATQSGYTEIVQVFRKNKKQRSNFCLILPPIDSNRIWC